MGPVPSYNKKRKSCLIMKVRLPVMNDGKGKAKAIMPPLINVSNVEDEALDWGKDHSDKEFEFNKTSDVNNMRDLTPMAWERKDEHYDAYYDGIALSVFSSIDQIGTDLLSNQGWLSHGLNRSVDSSICINGRVTVDTPVCNIICKCLSSNCQNFPLPHVLPKHPGPFHGILVYSCSFPGVLVCSCFVLVHSHPIPNLEKNCILIRFLS